jgi:hypothetical protein
VARIEEATDTVCAVVSCGPPVVCGMVVVLADIAGLALLSALFGEDAVLV